MKLEDYEKLAAGITAENAPAIMKDVLSGLKSDLTERDALAEKVAELDKKNRDLQDTNIKLFLSQTSPATRAPEDDGKTGVEALDAFAAKMKETYEEDK